MQYARILIIDDDPIVCTLLAGWARHLGSAVTEVDGTVAADAALAESEYDLVLSDVHLPGNLRLEWVEKTLARDFPPPLVLITGNPELETTLRAANLPIAGYLVKPPNFAALQALAQRLVTDHRRRRELRELSRDAAMLLTQVGAQAGPVSDKLLQLSRALAAEAGRHPREAASGTQPAWRDIIAETIATLEKTKDSFRSKELGRLRSRLEQVLGGKAAA